MLDNMIEVISVVWFGIAVCGIIKLIVIESIKFIKHVIH